MAIGIQPTKQQLDDAMGTLARDIAINLERAAKFKQFFNQFTATQIETKFGYPTGEGAVIKSAFNDLNVLNQIFLGNATLAQSGSGSATVPYDFTTFIRQLWGTEGAF